MNYPRFRLTLWALALCLLFAVAVSPLLANTQAGSSDASSSVTTRKSKRKSGKAKASASSAPAASAPAPSAAPSDAISASSATSAPGKTRAAASPAAAASEIAAAKASGKVWVNLDSGIYHKGGRWYGKTKDGKFMTEAEAKAGGYKESRRD